MARKLGRNDPCWCGSGVKYKKCHLDREQQSRPGQQEVLQHTRGASGGYSSMPSCVCCDVDAPGDHDPMTSHRGRRSTITSASGVTTGSGRK